MDWKLALKVGGPSVVVTWVVYSFSIEYMNQSELFKSSTLLNLTLILGVFTFSGFMGWLLVRNTKPSLDSVRVPKAEVQDNEVVDNDIGGVLNVGKSAKLVKGNKVKKNKIKGDVNIG